MANIPLLPPKDDVESKAVLKKAAEAHRYLAELKGVASSIPNQRILLDTLTLQEARESSAIENIVSTFDEVYKSNAAFSEFTTPAAKEVHAYAKALKVGYELVKQNHLLTNNHILEIQEIIEQNKAGFRKVPGTVLKKEQTGEVIYTPPQNYDDILTLMKNLEMFINDEDMYKADPLVKMAIVHHQFETIHPFYDGNGRTGRIINILYLIKNDLLSLPILYLSRYIIRHKEDYYRLLQHVRDTGEWEEWIVFILNATAETARESIALIKSIREKMQEYKIILREQGGKIYSQDLLNNLFRYPYTKIEYLMNDLNVSRNTAIRHLNILQDLNLVEKIKIGRDNYYVNKSLIGLLLEGK